MHAILLHHPLSYNKKRFWLYDFLKKKKIVTESIQKYIQVTYCTQVCPVFNTHHWIFTVAP